MKSLINFLREVKHDRSYIVSIPPCVLIGWALGSAIVLIRFLRQTQGLVVEKSRREIWIDLSSVDRFQRLFRIAMDLNMICEEKSAKPQNIYSIYQLVKHIFLSACSEKPVLRVFCRSGDQALWMIVLIKFLGLVVLDIYDSRPRHHNFVRRWLEKRAISSSAWLSVRDLRLSSNSVAKRGTTHRRNLIIDPPFYRSKVVWKARRIKFQDARIINIGWVGPPGLQCPMVKTYKLLLSMGTKITILPATSQSWNDPSLQVYVEMARRFENMKLMAVVPQTDLMDLMLEHDFGLLASDWEWNLEDAPIWAQRDDTPKRNNAMRLSDYASAGLGLITCRRKWFSRRFAARYGLTTVFLDDFSSGAMHRHTWVNLENTPNGRDLEVEIGSALKWSHSQVA